jgi:hypothetical protein
MMTTEPNIIQLAAERTLLCLKACDNVPNEDLERIVKNGTFAEILRLREQRDDLIAVLKSLFDECDTKERNSDGTQRGVRMPSRQSVDAARAAIAKCSP